ncbi:MAG: tetratricopeptide repeat protein [Gammaproteobacteria bacterium]|nr:tetratricopeptide repeat protein [Gammaproteobacteria bacterium]
MGPWHKAWPRRRDDLFVASAFLLLVLIAPAYANSYTPADRDVVLATIAPVAHEQRERIASLRSELERDTGRADIAVSLVRLYQDIYSQSGDPRYIGYAESAVAKVSQPHPVDLRLQSARLLQARHDFQGARRLLDEVVATDPTNAEAWSLLTSLAVLRGDYATARNACARMALLGYASRAIVCGTELASLHGRSAEAYENLSNHLSKIDDPDVASWAHQVAADIALRLDRTERAIVHGRQSLTLKSSLYGVVRLSDFLMRDDRYEEALKLLQTQPRTDAVVLRQARANKALGKSVNEELLAQRMTAIQRRGDTAHAREEAYYALYIADDDEMAVDAAARNWDMQREPIDAELLLRAAARRGDAAAAAPVLTWLRGSDDQALMRIAGDL